MLYLFQTYLEFLVLLERQLQLLLQLEGYLLRQSESMLQTQMPLMLSKVMKVLDVSPHLAFDGGKDHPSRGSFDSLRRALSQNEIIQDATSSSSWELMRTTWGPILYTVIQKPYKRFLLNLLYLWIVSLPLLSRTQS